MSVNAQRPNGAAEGIAVVLAVAVAPPLFVIPQRSGGICCQSLLLRIHPSTKKRVILSEARSASRRACPEPVEGTCGCLCFLPLPVSS
jgi:hypothetical protein